MTKDKYIIAVDFDGTLVEGNTFPEIGTPRLWLIEQIKEWQTMGHKLILWTCREDVCEGEHSVFYPRLYLTEAIEWCKQFGLVFDAINQNMSEIDDPTIKTCRKIFADFYIDDRAASFSDSTQMINLPSMIRTINISKVTN